MKTSKYVKCKISYSSRHILFEEGKIYETMQIGNKIAIIDNISGYAEEFGIQKFNKYFENI